MRCFLLIIPFCVAAAMPARATDGLDCRIDDKFLSGHVGGLMGSQPGVVQVSGEFALRAAGVPDYFRKIKIAGDDLRHSWAHGGEIRLHVYKEHGEPNGSLELIIQTKVFEEEAYRGTYELEVNFTAPGGGASAEKTIRAKGKAGCEFG